MDSDGRGPQDKLRIGFILPSVNTVVEPWYNRCVPEDVTVHFARMLLPDRLTPDSVRQMDREDGRRAMLQIASCRPASVIYACFASSVVQGPDYDRALAADAGDWTGCPSDTAAGASIAALKAVGVSRVGIISPYSEAIDAAERAYLEACGLTVAAFRSFGITDAFELAGLSSASMVSAAIDMTTSVDGFFISCMNTRSHETIALIETATGLPVVTATSATLWQGLRLAGRRDPLVELGQLGTAA